MQWIGFVKNIQPEKLKIAILAYELNYDDMYRSYFKDGLIQMGGGPEIIEEVVALKLPFEVTGIKKKKKALPVSERREALAEILEHLSQTGVEHILVANPDYFKTLTGSAKAALEVGSLFPPSQDHFEGYSHMKVGYIPNYKQRFYDPVKTMQHIEFACEAVIKDRAGRYKEPGTGLFERVWYPLSLKEINHALHMLYEPDKLAADIEGFGLHPHDAGIATISFAIDKHNAIAFQVDYSPGMPNWPVRTMLANFFSDRHGDGEEGKKNAFIWHNAGYDVPAIVHALSQDPTRLSRVNARPFKDRDIIFDWLTEVDQIEDTKLISYLATNSTAGNKLGLKEQAVEFAGNYAVEEIKDITKIPVDELLEYNAVDACSTWYVYEKNYPLMVQDNQRQIYEEIFKPALVDIIDMQLNGLPVNMETVKKSKRELQLLEQAALDRIYSLQVVQEYTHHLKEKEVEKKNAAYKKKRIAVSDVNLDFNPGSDIQLAGLLYDGKFCGLPVLGKTESGAPSTQSSYLKDLKNHTTEPETLTLLDAVMEYKDVRILLSTFIPALEGARWNASLKWHFMLGNFNLGGTVSGRLSSSNPNLQNIPSGSRLAKFIKVCIEAPPGWLFVGLDFDSLEDKISALLTKDPNKLKVYTDGYDGHSLRAYSYFGDQMPDIDPGSVDSINSIGVKYKQLRQNSKAPTFALTYGGTEFALMNQCGFTKEEALKIQDQYHELYKVSDDWVDLQIQGARENGYITVAFGLRVRTPVLGQTIDSERYTPYAAKAESRTAGNALGQSWGLLNSRACSEFMNKVRQNNGPRNSIRVCCHIHDAQYYMIKDNALSAAYVNTHLVKAVQWQEHPAIQHDDVKLSGGLSIFYPTWADEYEVSIKATNVGSMQKVGEEIMRKTEEKKNA